jgi:DNA adenine methylase
VNLQGKFNVPYNHKTHLNPCDKEKIVKASLALSRASITHCDFEHAVKNATDGDFVYFDPPYAVSAGPRGFVKYNAVVFSWEDQLRLARVARSLASRGCHVLVSNANHPVIRELYQAHGFHAHTITRLSVIAAKSKHRGDIAECLFYRR